MKINDLLNIKSNYSNDEKKIILSFLLDLPKLDLFKLEEITDKKVINKYKKKLNNNLPLAYLLNEAYFFGNKFYVNKNVLIPRPETEVLVEEVYNLINKYFNDKVKICDLGTGSGVIGITLKKLNNSFDVTCIDISKKALKVAKKNSIYLNADINFINSDMLKRVNDNFDVIISNPPYIKNNTKEIDNIVEKYEPSLALYGGDDGLKYYKEILKTCKKNLNDKSIIAFEIGYDLKEDIINIIKEYFKDCKIICKKDYNDLDRYIFILNNLE